MKSYWFSSVVMCLFVLSLNSNAADHGAKLSGKHGKNATANLGEDEGAVIGKALGLIQNGFQSIQVLDSRNIAAMENNDGEFSQTDEFINGRQTAEADIIRGALKFRNTQYFRGSSEMLKSKDVACDFPEIKKISNLVPGRIAKLEECKKELSPGNCRDFETVLDESITFMIAIAQSCSADAKAQEALDNNRRALFLKRQNLQNSNTDTQTGTMMKVLDKNGNLVEVPF